MEGIMGGKSETPRLPGSLQNDVTTRLATLMQRDLVFVMRFIGESQQVMQAHFQDFILHELALTGVTPETHPMLHAFAEKHALMLRDFVFSGVSLSRQFRVEQMEQLTGDTMIRVDVWDQLRSHINTAEGQFRTQLPELPPVLEAWKAPRGSAMSIPDPDAFDLLRRRVACVAQVSALTSKAMKLSQAASGIDMDMLRIEIEIGKDPGNGQLAQELRDIEARAATMGEAQADCAEEIVAAEEDVAALDRLIAAARGE
jgi:hypothetical protein